MLWAPTFTSPNLEREYQAQLVTEKIRLTRLVAVLGGALDLCFVVLDLWAIPSALAQVWTLRAIILTILLLAFVSTWHPQFARLYLGVIVTSFLVMAAGMCGMVLLARPDEAAINEYFGGLLLVVIGLHTMTYLHLWLSLGMSLLMLASYAAIVALVHGHTSGDAGVVLVSNLFIGASAVVICMVAQASRDRYARENYLLRYSLQRDVELKEEESRRASYLAEHDPLTGLANRLRFEREGEAMIDAAASSGDHVAVMFIDLDEFKPVNDRYGHAVGDRVLRLIAERLRNRLRGDDLCARFGGDEFLVAMQVRAQDAQGVRATAERLARAIELDIDLRGTVIRVSASIGVAGFPMDGRDLETLMRRADARMYQVKHHGRNGMVLPEPWDAAAPAETRTAS
jgi:diguanylate cyclase (GGDEF)-like protein